ncbi:Urease accessory protein [Phytophthora megakarya]|uniref:Urease accessory protein n=1 Tax=Phytophthora megakarya TaxID=4795 RepID=A0A225W022_9STRA|nr:Urease accessory protein [Phytophthora megakarya]
MGRHVEATLQQFFPGVLPRVRCPVCLVLLHVSRWENRVPIDMKTALINQYSSLCSKTCTVTPPCCHKTNYSHLPEFQPYHKPSSLIKLLPSQLQKFTNLCKQFCRHKVEPLEPRTVLNYAFATFGEEKAAILVNELTLYNIQDAERRATLLLSLMYLRPNTRTNCCGHDFCFNCKRQGHHETCAVEFNEENDLVRCRSCRSLLLKVEGCDAVNCVCGFNMDWSREISLRQQYKKNLLPLDIFDVSLMYDWSIFQSSELSSAWMAKRIDKHLVAVGRIIRVVITRFIWRFRLRKILQAQLSEACTTRRAKYVDENIAVVSGILREPVIRYKWRCRFRKALANMEPVMYWKARRRWHPEELEAEADEINTLFSIGGFEEE